MKRLVLRPDNTINKELIKKTDETKKRKDIERLTALNHMQKQWEESVSQIMYYSVYSHRTNVM